MAGDNATVVGIGAEADTGLDLVDMHGADAEAPAAVVDERIRAEGENEVCVSSLCNNARRVHQNSHWRAKVQA